MPFKHFIAHLCAAIVARKTSYNYMNVYVSVYQYAIHAWFMQKDVNFCVTFFKFYLDEHGLLLFVFNRRWNKCRGCLD